MGKKRRFILFYCLFTLVAAIALLMAARRSALFAEWYASRFFSLFPHTLGRLFSPLPFSLFELLIVATGAGLLVFLTYTLLTLARGRAARMILRRRWLALGPRLGILCCTLLLMFTLTCGINYSRAPLAHALGLDPRPSTAQELRLLFTQLCQEAAEAAEKIDTDEQGGFLLSSEPREAGRAAMERLGGSYELFNTYYPKPKPVFCSIGLSYLHLAGIYSPFTIEANYNRHMPPCDIPFSICHELAHLSGYAKEDEANFIAFLACKESGYSDLYYSGLLNAISYVLNALYGEMEPAKYRELFQELPAQARRDLQLASAYWQSFAGPAAELSRNVNDIYLKANDQPEGVKSYGRLVDLLLAYYDRSQKLEDRR